jgi:hypothetical protein
MKDIVDLIFEGKRETAPDGTDRFVDECGIAYPIDLLKTKLRNSETTITTLVDCKKPEPPKDENSFVIKSSRISTGKIVVDVKTLLATFPQLTVESLRNYLLEFVEIWGSSKNSPSTVFMDLSRRYGLPIESSTQAKICRHLGLKVYDWKRSQFSGFTEAQKEDIYLSFTKGKETKFALSVKYKVPEKEIREVLVEMEGKGQAIPLPFTQPQKDDYEDDDDEYFDPDDYDTIDNPSFIAECRKHFIDEGWVTDKIMLHYPDEFPDKPTWRQFAAKHNLSRPSGVHRRLGSAEEQEIIRNYKAGMTEDEIICKYNRSRECIRPLLLRVTEEAKSTSPFPVYLRTQTTVG